MDPVKSRIKDLMVGDLVTHILYGKEWIGVILGFRDEDNKKTLHSEKALVQIQPGTKYEGFFTNKVSKINRINDNLGYVSANWLFKIEIKK
tara:strand:- start:855 stop:1127 length:273 start_codon:yes stop_codon:yes gene_type:complete